MVDKDRYDYTTIEKKWQVRWSQVKLDTPAFAKATAGKPFYNLMMFPYPSAEGLHVGNMYAFTGSDIYGRFKRMAGYSVFEPIGLDGFGIHSENYALKIGTHPVDHAKISEKNFYRQLQQIGCMFDWSRKLETYDTDYYRWTQWIFVQMFKHGLAYRAKSQVNWCPNDKTVLADEQVIEGKCERCGNMVEKRLLEQWFFRITAYAEKLLGNTFSLDWSEKVLIAQRNWIGKKEGVIIHHKVKDLDVTLDAFSAFPAWLFADTFLVLAPDHPQVETLVQGTVREKEVLDYIKVYKNSKKKTKTKADEKEGIFTGRYVIDPFSGSKMPVWLANFALMDFGTGIIRCSAHDARDWEFSKKYKIALKEVVDRTNPKTPVNAHENKGTLKDSGPFSGRTIDEKLISDVVSWIVQEKIGKREVTYHLRDWLISRQRYWGPPIPMIFCEACEKAGRGEQKEMLGWWTVPEDELPVELPYIKDYKPGDDGVAPLAKHKEFYHVACPECGSTARRETDVSDTFLDSSWYFLRYPSVGISTPEVEELPPQAARDTSGVNKQLPWDPVITKKWLPVSMYTGGAEHSVLHLMYSRFVTMALKDWGYLDFEEPFPNFYAHGLLIKDCAKMSKSKGNVVNPDEYIKLYGTDALRLYLMFMGPFDQGGDFRDSAMEGMSRWVNRVWRLAMASLGSGLKSSKGLTPTMEIKKALHRLVKKVTEDTERRRYNTAIAAMMKFTNFIGDRGGSLDPKSLKTFVLLLAPYAPHIAEELWERLGGSFSVHQQPWPSFDEKALVEEEVPIIVQVNGKLRDTCHVSRVALLDQGAVEKLARGRERVKKYLEGKKVQKVVFVAGKLINFVV